MLGLFGKNKETPLEIPPTLPPKLLDQDGISIFDRQSLLLCLVRTNHTVTRDQVDQFAHHLQLAPEVSIARICQESGAFSYKAQEIAGDPILNRFGLVYDQAEVEEKLPIDSDGNVIPYECRVPQKSPLSPVDWIAGEGPQRPIVMELHRLYSLGALAEAESNGRNRYVISNKGVAHHRSLEIIAELTDWSKFGDPLIMVDKYSKTAISKRHPRS